MKIPQHYLVFLCTALLVSGCTKNLVTQKRVLVINDPRTPDQQLVSVPVDLRLSRTFKGNDGKYYICDQPAVDVARSDSFGSKKNLAVQLSDSNGTLKQNISGNGERNSTTTVLQLNGRSESVVLTRDIMHQECLSRANGTYTELKEQFSKAWEVAINISTKEKNQAIANKLNAEEIVGFNPKILSNTKQELIAAKYIDLVNQLKDCEAKKPSDATEQEKCLAIYKNSSRALLGD